MKIAMYGATGNIGQRILNEALERGHEVTAVVRDPAKITIQNTTFQVVRGDIFNPENIAAITAGHEVVISSYGNSIGEGFVDVAKALIAGVELAAAQRLLIVGGCGSLEVAPGVRVLDTPEWPEAWKPNALAQSEALKVYRNSSINWTYLSCPLMIKPGERLGTYRTDLERLVLDDKGESNISYEDYAVAMLDEVENPRFIRQRFTVAY